MFCLSYPKAGDRAKWQILGAQPIGVVVADHEIVSEGLRAILEAKPDLEAGGDIGATEDLFQLVGQLGADPACGC